VDLSDDLPPPRRPLFFPVVIATVLLSLIGVGAGLAIGARHRDDNRTNPPIDQPKTPTVAPTTGGPTGKACLPQTRKTAEAHGISEPLTQVLVIKTRTSVAYICQDPEGHLYYHANNTRGGEPWIEGKSAIFLTDVVQDGDGYRATADDGVVFSVTRSRLEILHKDGSTETQNASP
jgi:hypothetical protein